jgi:hypothetical protein
VFGMRANIAAPAAVAQKILAPGHQPQSPSRTRFGTIGKSILSLGCDGMGVQSICTWPHLTAIGLRRAACPAWFMGWWPSQTGLSTTTVRAYTPPPMVLEICRSRPAAAVTATGRKPRHQHGVTALQPAGRRHGVMPAVSRAALRMRASTGHVTETC